MAGAAARVLAPAGDEPREERSERGRAVRPLPEASDLRRRLRRYWGENPSGYHLVRQLEEAPDLFFAQVDRRSRALYPALDRLYGFAEAAGRRTLEAGCGLGFNAERLARHGARLVVMDMAPRSVALTRRRFALRGLAADFVVGDLEALPFRDGAFECAFSSGVLHHLPDPARGVAELRRTLVPGGSVSAMVYHRGSLHHRLRIQVGLRAVMVALGCLPQPLVAGAVRRWPRLAWYRGAGRWPRRGDLLRAGTDHGGLANPLSRVFSRREARRLFAGFEGVRLTVAGMAWQWATRLPTLLGWPLAALHRAVMTRVGWFLYVRARKGREEA